MKVCLAIVLFLISLILPSTYSYAQKKQGQALIDSLVSQLPKVQNDTTRINVLNDISSTYRNINPAEGINYANQGLALAEKSNWKKGIANAYGCLGGNYNANQEYTEAISYFEKAIQLNQALDRKLNMASNYHNLGYAYYSLNNYPLCLRYTNQALALNEEINNKNWITINYQLIGDVYLDQVDYPKALDAYQKAKNIGEELGNKRTIATMLNNISIVYHRQADFPKALEYLIKALRIQEELGNEQQIAGVLNNIGNIYLKQAEYPKALDYFLKALQTNEKTNNQRWKAVNLNNIGIAYFEQANYPQAFDYFTNAASINEGIGENAHLGINLINIGNVYQKQKNYSKALAYEFKALALSRKTENENNEASALSAIGVNYFEIAKDSNLSDLNQLFQGNKITCLQAAKAYTDSAILKLQKTRDLNDLYRIYGQQSDINALLGDPVSALVSFKHYVEIKDSVFNLEKDKKITQTALSYEFAKREDSLKLETEKREIGLQKEMALKSLSYEYEKKRQAAKTEEEKQKLVFEEKLKQQEIENTYAQKIAAAEALQKQTELEAQKKELERKQKEELAKTEQEKKDIRQRNIRNSILLGLGATLLFLVVVYRQRNKIAKEKQRSEELLLNILPAETAEELKATGAAQAKDFSEVTVLFTDFKNFTAMSEHLSAQELVNEINYYYSAFDKIISTHHIEKIKTIGDAYMCAGGLPTANKTHAADTVKAALEIRDFMNAERKKRQAQGKPFLEIRIGCNTGPVIAGIVGIKKFAYDIWGDTVNTASRIESSGEVGKVNISGSTYELVKDKFTCIYRGKIEAKNKGEIDMYFVEA